MLSNKKKRPYKRFVDACKLGDDAIVWHMFDYIIKEDTYHILEGLCVAGFFKQIRVLKVFASLLREKNYENGIVLNSSRAHLSLTNLLTFMDFERYNEYLNVVNFMREFIPFHVGKPQHETNWFKLMVAYVLKKRNLELIVIDLYS